MPYWWLWAIGAYLVGSIPFGLLIGLARGVDIRKAGSGNVGATNVVRLLGLRLGALCFALDVLKGLGPTLAAGLVTGVASKGFDIEPGAAWQWLAVGAAAVLGHVFSFWLRFRGGKGVATSLGVLLGFWPILTLPALAGLLTWLLWVGAFRYVSLASMVTGALIPVYLWTFANAADKDPARLRPFLIVTGALALLVVIRHRTNAARLAHGTEPRVGEGKRRT